MPAPRKYTSKNAAMDEADYHDAMKEIDDEMEDLFDGENNVEYNDEDEKGNLIITPSQPATNAPMQLLSPSINTTRPTLPSLPCFVRLTHMLQTRATLRLRQGIRRIEMGRL